MKKKLDDYISNLKAHFNLQSTIKSTCFLFGSSVTGFWAPSRSDLDVVFIIKNKSLLEDFDKLIGDWKTKNHEILLDGYIVYEDDSKLYSKSLLNEKHNLFPKSLPTPEQWSLKYQSKKIFGEFSLTDILPEVSRENLIDWAKANKQQYWIPYIGKIIRKVKKMPADKYLPIDPAIWIASGAARIKSLELTGKCLSKQNA